MKARVLSLILTFTFFTSSPVSAESLKIGYIHIDKIIEESSFYNSANDQLNKQFEPKQKELFDLLEHINLLKQSLNLESDKAPKKEKIEKIQILETELQFEAQNWQQELNQKQIELLQEIELVINKVVNDYAIRKKYDLILYENIAFVSEKLDLTAKIIEELEKFQL